MDPAAHKSTMVKILKDIYSDPATGPFLGFKGGTAAFLFYGLDRFSVDLDFDLLDGSKKSAVFENLGRILIEHGRIKTADKKKYSLIYILDYLGKDPGAQNIKVEVNLRDFGFQIYRQDILGYSDESDGF